MAKLSKSASPAPVRKPSCQTLGQVQLYGWPFLEKFKPQISTNTTGLAADLTVLELGLADSDNSASDSSLL